MIFGTWIVQTIQGGVLFRCHFRSSREILAFVTLLREGFLLRRACVKLTTFGQEGPGDQTGTAEERGLERPPYAWTGPSASSKTLKRLPLQSIWAPLGGSGRHLGKHGFTEMGPFVQVWVLFGGGQKNMKV